MGKELTNEYHRLLKELTDSTYSMLAACKQRGDSRAEVLYKLAVAMNRKDIPEELKIVYLKGVKRIMDDIHY